jgi:hypothetical protein
VDLRRQHSNTGTPALDQLRRPGAAGGGGYTRATERPANEHPPGRRPWTPQVRLADDTADELVTLYATGRTVKELAGHFRVNRQTIAAWLTRRGVDRRPRGLTAEQVERAIELYIDGWSLRRIGRLLGAADATVWKALKTGGVQTRRPWERG